MGYVLCTAEKPSVARDIASVLGATKKENGYLIGNGYIVTWAVGHLVGLAEPEAYGFVKQSEMYGDDESRQKAYAELPLLPQQFKLIVLEQTKDQFAIVKELMHRADVDYIIDCGDMGAEGHILQWFIREKAENKKPVKRFCATSMTDEAIKEAMNNLREEKEFLPVIKGEFCKKKEDWILGMSLSRALSIKHHAGINVGRVQSPTLGFIVSRFLEVSNFKVTNFYTLEAKVNEGKGFKVFWKSDNDGVFSVADKTSDGRVLNRAAIDIKRDEINRSGKGVIVALAMAKKATDRPQLYDITELQREANRQYGYTAAVTLATAQALYETQKVLSYPRTDSRYITHDLVPYMEERIKAIGTIAKYKTIVDIVIAAGLNIDKKIVDDTKVTDHHALILTEKIKDFDLNNFKKVSPEEAKKGVTVDTMNNILDLVISRMLVAFSFAYKYEQTNITVSFDNGMNFSAQGKKPVSLGWKAVQQSLSGKGERSEVDDGGEDEEQIFPTLQKGQSVTISQCVTLAGKTSPPKLHTEATLLTAMECAGQHIDNGAILKGKGIGTQATRAEIIKKLYDTAVVETETKGKTPYIIPTKKGLSIIQVLPPDLYSPKITADWEMKIADIIIGKEDEISVMRAFERYIKDKTEQIKNMTIQASFSKEKEVFGVCPWCGSPVYRYQTKTDKGKISDTRFYCSEKCSWELKLSDTTFLTRLGRKLTETEAKRLIAKKFIVLECVSPSGGAKHRGEFSFIERISKDKRYCNIKCERIFKTSNKK